MTPGIIERLMATAPVGGKGRAIQRTGRDNRLEFTNGVPADKRILDASIYADDESIRKIIEAYLFPSTFDAQVWALLSRPETIDNTLRALTDMKLDIQQQFTARRAEAQDEKNRCMKIGIRGRQPWFDYLADWEDWRGRANMFDRQVAKRIAQVRALVKDRNRARARNEDQLRDGMVALAEAIRRYQRSGDDSALQAVLHVVRIGDSTLDQILDAMESSSRR